MECLLCATSHGHELLPSLLCLQCNLNMNPQCSQLLTEANHLQVCAEVLQQLSELLQRCRNADQVLAEAGTLLGQAESELHHGGDHGSKSTCSAQVNQPARLHAAAAAAITVTAKHNPHDLGSLWMPLTAQVA